MALEGIKDSLKQRGVRLTRQRQILLELIDKSGQHLDAERLYLLAKEKDPKLNRVTVYRTLKMLKEGGVDVEANAWNGLIAPAKTPDAVVAAIAREVNEALRDGGVREKLSAQMIEAIGSSPAELRAFIDAEMARWSPVVKAAGIKIE